MYSKNVSRFIIFILLIAASNNALYSTNPKQQPVRFEKIKKKKKAPSNKDKISSLIKAMLKKEDKERGSNETMIKKEIEYLSALHVLLSAARMPNNDTILKTDYDNDNNVNKLGQYYCKGMWGLRTYKKVLKSVYENDEPLSLVFIQKVEKLLRKYLKKRNDEPEHWGDELEFWKTKTGRATDKAIEETTKFLLLKLNKIIISKLDDRIHRRIARAITIPLISSLTKIIYWEEPDPNKIATNFIVKLPEYIFIEIAAERILQSIEKAKEEK